MIKIVHITNDLERLGGVQRLLCDLIRLQSGRFSFEIVLTRGGNEYENEMKAAGVHVFYLKKLGVIGTIKKLNEADIVHAHLFPSIYVALLSSSLKICTEHNPYYRRRDYPFVTLLERVLFRRFCKVVCISEGVKEQFLKVVKLPDDGRVVTLYNGIDLNRFSMTPKAIGDRSGNVRLGMVGRLVLQKDIFTLLKLMQKLGAGYELHLAGDGPMRLELECFVRDNDLKDRVFFHGVVIDIPNFLEKLDIYIQSSVWEGFGLAVVEAMAAGLPCLTCNIPGLNNVALEEALFDVGDVDGLADKVALLVNDEEYYGEISKKSIERSLEFSAKTCADKYSDLYLEVMAS